MSAKCGGRRSFGRSSLRWVLTLALVTVFAASARSNVVCTNSRCITCDGPIVCHNDVCTCNGVPVDAGGGSGGSRGHAQEGVCGSEATVVHRNGGGKVSIVASVTASVFVSGDSAVCGHARVSGNSTLTGSTVNGGASVADSTLTGSTVTGSARVTQVTHSVINGAATVSDAEVVNSVLNGGASVVGRKVENVVINN